MSKYTKGGPFLSYASALFLTLCSVALRACLEPFLGNKQPFLMATLVVTLAAIYLGLGPALLSLACSLLVGTFLFASRTHSFFIGMEALFGVFSYAFVSLVIILLASSQRKAKDQARESAEEVRNLNTELESRVEERTADLKVANAELADFTHSIAHDMRQYLRGVNIATHALLEDCPNIVGEDSKERLESLGRNARHANELVDGLLTFFRLGRGDIRRSETDISAVAQAIALRLSRLPGEQEVEVSVQSSLLCYADPELAEIVLQNLIENAFKYRCRSGRPFVQIGLDPQRGFFVKDNGIGFDMKFVDRIFLPFERLHRQSDYPGTGIGLASVRRIVGKHGGKIWAQSEPGKGSCFYFTLEPSGESVAKAA